ncbi:hypothetical protein EZV62_008474 [Acer yangbiense]|uniref:Non-specific serine/threonine protein kinase n=1 Tax=Acer yangbiense TaxID=1000413 RepID=A0A5C7IE30_9ROSI|nr:hypothetical protein EZV62_008474 [Acer yangbiense]
MRESMEGFRLLTLYCFLFSSMRIATATLDTITLGQSIRDGETLVSADQRFELGFFSPGTSRSRYLGIWYKKVAPKTTVCVANRDTPISDPSGILNINVRGILVLLNSTNNTVWSSNASRSPQNPVALLLGSGNLVVKDGNDNNPDNFLWQSFDYPGNTLLPGMKIGINLVTGLEWFYTSWKSTDDPSQGEFTVIIDPHRSPQLFLKMGPVIVFRGGSWNGVGWTGIPHLKLNPLFTYNFVSNEKELFTWMDQTRSWAEYYAKTRDGCDNYAKCGAYASCNINNFPVCTCFKGFVPKSQQQWSIYNWSAGCIRKTPLDCQHGDGFVKHEAVKLPDTSHSSIVKYISLVQCKILCINNCSCTAYATLDIREGGSGCLLWFTDLFDIKDVEGGQDSEAEIGSWNGLHWIGSPQLKPIPLYTYSFVSNEKEVFYTCYARNSSILSRVAPSTSGVVQRFTWMDQTRSWAEYYAKTRDECNNMPSVVHMLFATPITFHGHYFEFRYPLCKRKAQKESGYMSPEYAIEGIFSIKSDVFSFGVLLLEIVSGKKNTGFHLTVSLNLLGYVRKQSSWFSLSLFVLFNTTLFMVWEDVRDLKKQAANMHSCSTAMLLPASYIFCLWRTKRKAKEEIEIRQDMLLFDMNMSIETSTSELSIGDGAGKGKSKDAWFPLFSLTSVSFSNGHCVKSLPPSIVMVTAYPVCYSPLLDAAFISGQLSFSEETRLQSRLRQHENYS